ADLLEDLRAQGFVRVRVRSDGRDQGQEAGSVHELDSVPPLNKSQKHSIDVVVDRIKVTPTIQQRLAESFETALRLADGRAVAAEMDTGREHVFSSKFACPVCNWSLRD